jgi:hypothetical protein
MSGSGEHEASLAVLSGWPLLAAFALVLVLGAFVKSRRLFVVGLVVVETLLVFWLYSLGRLL